MNRAWRMRDELAPRVTVGVLIVAYVALFGTLSLRRHQNLGTHALDLGYTDQVVWNTLHGRPFRFSTFLDAAFDQDIPIHDMKQPDMLLGYHVEPILAALAPFYLLHDGPETLLWIQTVVMALGAIPLYLLVRHRLAARHPQSRLALHVSEWLPTVYVLLYFLAPPLEAANLSDFHAVALSPAFLLAAFYYLETGRPLGMAAFAFLAAMCKEEMGLLVAMLGLWAAMARRRWRLGLGTIIAGIGWSLLCTQVIMPHFSGLSDPAFVVRYSHFGDSTADIKRNLVERPSLFLDWLGRPDVLNYLRDLGRVSGGLSILHPPSLALALPAIAINALSNSGWMRSGGAHYSAAIVPFMLISAAYGVDALAWRAANGKRPEPRPPSEPWPRVPRTTERAPVGIRWTRYAALSLALVAAGLSVALVYHYQNGVSPLSRRFVLEPVSEHARRAQVLITRVNQLPPEMPISVSSTLYSHVSHRERVYLLPTVSDAQAILLDTTSPLVPISGEEAYGWVQALLEWGGFGVAESDHGLLLLERGLDRRAFAPSFYDVFLPSNPRPQYPQQADFGGLLRLEGWDRTVRPVIRPELEIQITTYWQVQRRLDSGYRFVFYFWDAEGRLVYVYAEEQVAHWYPTWLWEPGRIVQVTSPPLLLGDVPRLGVAVLRPGNQPDDASGRLVPIASVAGATSPAILPSGLLLREGDTILELVRP